MTLHNTNPVTTNGIYRGDAAAYSANTGVPRLLADIGGTNARFALETRPGKFEAILVLPCKEFPTLNAALKSYLNCPVVTAVSSKRVRHACIAIANPVSGDHVRMTNHHWEFSIKAVRKELRLETLLVVNDFMALAMALPRLDADQMQQIGGDAPEAQSPVGLIGPGTGLGVSGLISCNGQWVPFAGEGGHVSFAPCDERELHILQFAWKRYPHVSAERLLSGEGLELIYSALHELRRPAGAPALSAHEITRLALNDSDPLCKETIECFCCMLGSVAGNLALTMGARGGLYIGGGIVPRFPHLLMRSGFRQRFERKGRLSAYLATIPVYLITAGFPAFSGASAILSEHLTKRDNA